MSIEWQPISTAPKDGTWIIGALLRTKWWVHSRGLIALPAFDSSDIFFCRWMTAHDLAEEYGGSAVDYIDACWDNGKDNAEFPTHWMPLPPPPPENNDGS